MREEVRFEYCVARYDGTEACVTKEGELQYKWHLFAIRVCVDGDTSDSRGIRNQWKCKFCLGDVLVDKGYTTSTGQIPLTDQAYPPSQASSSLIRILMARW